MPLPLKIKKNPTAFFSRNRKEPEEPIRAELFSIERLEQHAESLAQAQQITLKRSRGQAILRRVRENGRVLRAAHLSMTKTVREERAVTPAAEWFIDNFHIIEEQILEIDDDLPPEFYRELPKLTQGFLEGTPRIYGVAWAFVAHTDSRFDHEWLRRFMRAYQKAGPLTIGEVWALAINLRIVLVENLRRLVDRLVYSKAGQSRADALADSLLGLKGQAPAGLDKVLASFGKAPLEKSFAVQLVLRLRDQGEGVAPVLQWLDDQLKIQGTAAEDLVRLEHHEQTAMNTTVRNVITSMRLVSALDWSQFFEDVSAVDEIFRNESGFSAMDFPTRDLYRHAIEELARGSDLSEVEVTRRAIRAAKAADITSKKLSPPSAIIETHRANDPGYVLIARGRLRFEKEINCRISFKRRFFRAYVSRATFAYLGTVALITGCVLALPLYMSYQMGISLAALIAFAAAALVPASDLAIALVNRWVTQSMGPRPLPKLDFKKGIPAGFRTLVVMPTLLSSLRGIQENLERLEIHYLGNPEGYLQFGLLTDSVDAAQEHTPKDDALFSAAREGIQKLNARYGPGPENTVRFFLFHRRRLWNEREGLWMGWERKRGKLHELNRLLRGDSGTTFVPASTAVIPQNIRYIITLDADTRMSFGTAYRLAGAMAHPLNRPLFDSKTGRIVEGYGVMQPRITPTLPAAGEESWYQRIFSGKALISGKGFMTSTRSNLRLPAASPKTACSATICSKACTHARHWRPTSNSLKSFPLIMKSPFYARIDGCAEIGSCFLG